jgi:hypothetical protein
LPRPEMTVARETAPCSSPALPVPPRPSQEEPATRGRSRSQHLAGRQPGLGSARLVVFLAEVSHALSLLSSLLVLISPSPPISLPSLSPFLLTVLPLHLHPTLWSQAGTQTGSQLNLHPQTSLEAVTPSGRIAKKRQVFLQEVERDVVFPMWGAPPPHHPPPACCSLTEHTQHLTSQGGEVLPYLSEGQAVAPVQSEIQC